MVGSKMVVFGGDSGQSLLDDTKVSWGKNVILVGGKSDQPYDKISETIRNSSFVLLQYGPSIQRVSSGLIWKRRVTFRVHCFRGAGPSPRSNHVAALYDDRVLLIFGGQSKSKTLNDIHALDFETMVWSRVKTHGHHPSPRAGCCGALCGTKWYIAGGGSKKKRHPETWVFDVLESRWSVCVVPPSSSITTKKGFSMVPLYYRDKIVLVAFGGNKKEPSDKVKELNLIEKWKAHLVEVLVVLQNEHCFSWRSAPEVEPLLYDESPPGSRELADHLSSCAPPYPTSSAARSGLAATAENSCGRKPLPDSLLRTSNLGGSSLRRQFRQEEECSSLAQKLQKPIDDDRYKDAADECSEHQPPSATNPKPRNDARRSSPEVVVDAKARRLLGRSSSDMNNHQDARVAALVRRNVALEEQLSAALASKDEAEKNLSLVIDSKDGLEKRLAEKDREVEALREKATGLELAQEEANSLSNTVHADNVRLEREVAFLKAVMDETQKARENCTRLAEFLQENAHGHSSFRLKSFI
ncbi:Galactose oxidase/kelch repeat superfamily protein [Zea mays]|uniref:Galactose oxidase/kelch repeat superfamily protein n=1 Tax=Zea mays TaxID=4577 RepID=A0A1D6PPA3_MAIZE|nr:Galactose oxidase/kelch repeat superfamily protein [Zea mays]